MEKVRFLKYLSEELCRMLSPEQDLKLIEYGVIKANSLTRYQGTTKKGQSLREVWKRLELGNTCLLIAGRHRHMDIEIAIFITLQHHTKLEFCVLQRMEYVAGIFGLHNQLARVTMATLSALISLRRS